MRTDCSDMRFKPGGVPGDPYLLIYRILSVYQNILGINVSSYIF
jgi:hypothetical protein